MAGDSGGMRPGLSRLAHRHHHVRNADCDVKQPVGETNVSEIEDATNRVAARTGTCYEDISVVEVIVDDLFVKNRQAGQDLVDKSEKNCRGVSLYEEHRRK